MYLGFDYSTSFLFLPSCNGFIKLEIFKCKEIMLKHLHTNLCSIDYKYTLVFIKEKMLKHHFFKETLQTCTTQIATSLNHLSIFKVKIWLTQSLAIVSEKDFNLFY
jgi:hypothetical protein